MNPYHPCVQNSIVNGTQVTVVFHVDDSLISHIDPTVVTDTLQKLSEVYGKTDPLAIQHGKHHEYLGMTINFQPNGDVMILMYDYIKKVIDKLPEDIIGHKPTSASKYLFKTNGTNTALLNWTKSDEYHSLTRATVLYLSMRTGVGLQLATEFLCTWGVKAPDEHDWKKLGHLMK